MSVQHLFVRQAKHASCEHPIILIHRLKRRDHTLTDMKWLYSIRLENGVNFSLLNTENTIPRQTCILTCIAHSSQHPPTSSLV